MSCNNIILSFAILLSIGECRKYFLATLCIFQLILCARYHSTLFVVLQQYSTHYLLCKTDGIFMVLEVRSVALLYGKDNKCTS